MPDKTAQYIFNLLAMLTIHAAYGPVAIVNRWVQQLNTETRELERQREREKEKSKNSPTHTDTTHTQKNANTHSYTHDKTMHTCMHTHIRLRPLELTTFT